MELEEIEKRYIILEIRMKKERDEFDSIRETNIQSFKELDRFGLRQMEKPDDRKDTLYALINRETKRLLCFLDTKHAETPKSFLSYAIETVERQIDRERLAAETFNKESISQEKKLSECTGIDENVRIAMENMRKSQEKEIDELHYDAYRDINSGFNLSGGGSSFYDLKASALMGKIVDGMGEKDLER